MAFGKASADPLSHGKQLYLKYLRLDCFIISCWRMEQIISSSQVNCLTLLKPCGKQKFFSSCAGADLVLCPAILQWLHLYNICLMCLAWVFPCQMSERCVLTVFTVLAWLQADQPCFCYRYFSSFFRLNCQVKWFYTLNAYLLLQVIRVHRYRKELFLFSMILFLFFCWTIGRSLHDTFRGSGCFLIFR